MKGYYKMPEATEKAVDADGWLHARDLATMDEAGNCKITGRNVREYSKEKTRQDNCREPDKVIDI